MKNKVRIRVAVLALLIFLGFLQSAFASRDWEYWSYETYTVPITKTVDYVVVTEWRFKNDMDYNYLFKVETGPYFKINKYLDIAPYYAYQEKQSQNMWDRSDLAYFDTTGKITLENFFDIKISNRFRYEYNFDKAKTVLRNSLKLSRGFKIGKHEIAPYFNEEPFYDCKLNRITEHRTSSGITYSFTKNISFSIGYMLNSKKGSPKWTYANVLVSNLSIRF
ncbi:MAG: DUF2490 domain-containing protein [Candidatus Omnitrophota bacterium]